MSLLRGLVRVFNLFLEFSIGNFILESFKIPHDASEPVGFCISKNDTKIGIVTDIGTQTDLVIQKLKGVSYNWTDPDNHDDEIGLIAQDVEQVVPEVVRSLGNSTLKGIEYQKLTAILIEAVKELSGKQK